MLPDALAVALIVIALAIVVVSLFGILFEAIIWLAKRL